MRGRIERTTWAMYMLFCDCCPQSRVHVLGWNLCRDNAINVIGLVWFVVITEIDQNVAVREAPLSDTLSWL